MVSIWLLLVQARAGLRFGLLTALAFIPSIGPHKFWTEPAAQALAPLLVVGTLCAATTLVTLGRLAFAQEPLTLPHPSCTALR